MSSSDLRLFFFSCKSPSFDCLICLLVLSLNLLIDFFQSQLISFFIDTFLFFVFDFRWMNSLLIPYLNRLHNPGFIVIWFVFDLHDWFDSEIFVHFPVIIQNMASKQSLLLNNDNLQFMISYFTSLLVCNSPYMCPPLLSRDRW